MQTLRDLQSTDMKLSELAEKTLTVIKQADENVEIESAAGLDIAENGQVTFLANPKYTPQIKTTRASAIFLNENVEPELCRYQVRD